jgi:hypothetical protein
MVTLVRKHEVQEPVGNKKLTEERKQWHATVRAMSVLFRRSKLCGIILSYTRQEGKTEESGRHIMVLARIKGMLKGVQQVGSHEDDGGRDQIAGITQRAN